MDWRVGAAMVFWAATAAAASPPPTAAAYATAPVKVSRAEARALEAVLEDAARIEVLCRRDGFALELELLDPAVVQVEIDGLDRPLTVSAPTRVFIPAPHSRGKRLERTLSYRVRYSSEVVAGFRPAPLRIRVMQDI